MTDDNVEVDPQSDGPTESQTVKDTDIWAAIQAYDQFVGEMDQFMQLMRTAIGISTQKLHRALSVLNEKVPMSDANHETLRRVFEEAGVEFEMELDPDDAIVSDTEAPEEAVDG